MKISDVLFFLICLLTISLAVCPIIILFAEEQKAQPNYLIKLPNRSFTPQPGISQGLKAKLAMNTKFPIHGIVQFFNKPSFKERLTLAKAGIQIRQYLGGVAYYAEFSVDTKFHKESYNIRWAGPLLIEDKIEMTLWESKVYHWAKTENKKVKILLYFYDYVADDDTKKLIASYTKKYRRHGPNKEWAIEISLDQVKKIADEEIVKWVEQGPQPFMPLLKNENK